MQTFHHKGAYVRIAPLASAWNNMWTAHYSGPLDDKAFVYLRRKVFETCRGPGVLVSHMHGALMLMPEIPAPVRAHYKGECFASALIVHPCQYAMFDDYRLTVGLMGANRALFLPEHAELAYQWAQVVARLRAARSRAPAQAPHQG